MSDPRHGCIGVKDGKISSVAQNYSLEELEGAEIIDAE